VWASATFITGELPALFSMQSITEFWSVAGRLALRQGELAGDPAVVQEVADLELLELAQGDDIAGEADVDFLGLAAL
jgi:hypothetical protein